MNKKINGIILSGGQSSRMGEDKALLQIGGRKIIELMIEKLKPFCNEIIISANDLDAYANFNCQVVPDKFRNSGPLAGIYSSLVESNHEKNFIISCDLLLVSEQVIERIVKSHSEKEIVLPVVEGKYQQMCGVYSKSVLPKAGEILKNEEGERYTVKGKRKTSVKQLLELCEVEFVDVTTIASENEFLNMNTKEDFAIIEEILLKRK